MTTAPQSQWTHKLLFFPETVTGSDHHTYYQMKWSYQSSFAKWTCSSCQKPFDYIITDGEEEETDVYIYAYMWETNWSNYTCKTPYQLCLTCIWDIMPHPTDQLIDEKEWLIPSEPISTKKLNKYTSWISDTVKYYEPLHAIEQLKSFLFKKHVALTTIQAKDLLLYVILPQLEYKEWFVSYCQLVYAFVWNKWDIIASHPIVGTYYRPMV